MCMQLPDINKNNVASFLDKEEIIRDTIAQIKKDFSMFGMEINFSGSIEQAYHEIYQQVVYQIERLLNADNAKLFSVLYQIDLNQTQIQNAQTVSPDLSLQEILSDQVIQRELKKVLTRRYFKAL